MGLFETLANDLRPENSKLSKAIEGYQAEEKEAELRVIAEEATKLVIEPDSPHYRNYVLMYMLGYQDCKLNQRSNLLDLIKE